MVTRLERTRARIQACALRLFIAQGYDGTTVEQIAAAAEVSHMTFFRHFSTKEAVLLWDPYDPLIAASVHAQPEHLTPLERVRNGLLAAWSAMPPFMDVETRTRLTIVSRHPALRGKAWENNQQTEQAIVDVLVASGTPAFDATVAAGACLGALMAAIFHWGDTDDDVPLGACVVEALNQLDPGCNLAGVAASGGTCACRPAVHATASPAKEGSP